MSLAPKLQKISVDVGKLLLDPNNPRLFSRDEERVPLERVADPGVQSSTEKRITPDKDRFKIQEIKDSIKTNGYSPEAGGYIFVRRLLDTDLYLVLEGNRRLTALRQLLGEAGTGATNKHISAISTIDVLEIIDDIPEEQLQEKISYLLGTCHHGSQKSWSPFARARGIYERYLETSNQTHESFVYQKTPYGESVASLLSIEEKEVAERLQVYQAMSQLAQDPRMVEREKGGIIDRYYSLILGGIKTRSDGLKNYIRRHPDSLELTSEAIDRLINLCNFDGTLKRATHPSGNKNESFSPPMNNPKQWGYLAKILDDFDEDKRIDNLELVEVHHQKPEDVWASRQMELTQMSWTTWLQHIVRVLSLVTIETDFEDPEAIDGIERLDGIADHLANKAA
jgi:hypothetical protein